MIGNNSVVPDYWVRAKRALARRDPVMAGIIRAHPRIGLRSRGDPFQTLARSIVGQQISVRAADSVWARFCTAAPTLAPAEVLVLGIEKLRTCGLSGRKAEYLRDLAQHFTDGTVHAHRWPGMDDEAVIAELTQVRGIGRWTAEMFLLFNLLRPDVLPLADLGLQRAVASHYFCRDDLAQPAVIQVLAEGWRPWRSVATWYLWRSLDPVPVEY
jgi:DNA-3-methyladenine glycosylase II